MPFAFVTEFPIAGADRSTTNYDAINDRLAHEQAPQGSSSTSPASTTRRASSGSSTSGIRASRVRTTSTTGSCPLSGGAGATAPEAPAGRGDALHHLLTP